jgi:myotubularin-related protein 6/7/8
VENVRLIDRFNNRQQIIGKKKAIFSFYFFFSKGTIYLTSTHLIYIDPEGKRETWVD